MSDAFGTVAGRLHRHLNRHNSRRCPASACGQRPDGLTALTTLLLLLAASSSPQSPPSSPRRTTSAALIYVGLLMLMGLRT